MAKPILALRGYTRAGSFPLDETSYFEDYVEALDYVHNNPSAYPGQVISVNDILRSKVKIYHVAYDDDEDAEFKYKLTEIGVGVSNGNGLFNYKGRLTSYNTLQTLNPTEGDMYYVMNTSSSGYSAYVYRGGAWIRLDLGITLASAKNDGLITKEMYRSLQSKEDAIYYSPGTNNPNENKFIPFDTIGESDSLRVMSTDKVRETIHSLVSADIPTVEIFSSVDLSDVLIGVAYADNTFTIKYHKNGGGNITSAVLTSGLFTDVVLNPEDFVYDANEEVYVASYVLRAFSPSNKDERNFVTITIDYDGNPETLMEPGTISYTYKINAYEIFNYRYSYYDDGLEIYTKDFTYGSNALRAKENEEYLISIIPNQVHGTNRIEILSKYPLKNIIHVEKQEDILNKFTKVYSADGNKYVFETYRNYPIFGKMTFKINT